jgi:hypothetical protein
VARAEGIDVEVVVPAPLGARLADEHPLLYLANLDVDADLLQLILEHHGRGGIEGAGGGEEEVELLAVWDAGFAEELPGPVQVRGVPAALQLLRWHEPIAEAGSDGPGDGAGAGEGLIDHLLAIDGQADGLAHPHVVPGLAQHVGDEDVEEDAGAAKELQVAVVAQAQLAFGGEEGVVDRP